MSSETSNCKNRLCRFCEGSGLDLGCGGDLITRQAIGVDLPKPYNMVGSWPIHLRGDARNLHWFVDECMDFVFSSHLLEDFPAEKTEAILQEWLRVLKPGGHLVIYGPDEEIYKRHCWNTGQDYNRNHSIDNFGAAYLAPFLERPDSKIVYRQDHCDTYGFELVAQKI